MKKYYEIMLNVIIILIFFGGLIATVASEDAMFFMWGLTAGGIFFSFLLFFKIRFST